MCRIRVYEYAGMREERTIKELTEHKAKLQYKQTNHRIFTTRKNKMKHKTLALKQLQEFSQVVNRIQTGYKYQPEPPNDDIHTLSLMMFPGTAEIWFYKGASEVLMEIEAALIDIVTKTPNPEDPIVSHYDIYNFIIQLSNPPFILVDTKTGKVDKDEFRTYAKCGGSLEIYSRIYITNLVLGEVHRLTNEALKHRPAIPITINNNTDAPTPVMLNDAAVMELKSFLEEAINRHKTYIEEITDKENDESLEENQPKHSTNQMHRTASINVLLLASTTLHKLNELVTNVKEK